MGQKHKDKKCSDTKTKHTTPSNSKAHYKGQQAPVNGKHSPPFDASYRYPASDIPKNHSSNKMCKGKHAAGSCQCSRFFDSSIPFNETPPPAPPDGRTDLWDLQFCRWWGWNWVRKHDGDVEGKTDEPRISYLSNYRASIDDQSPIHPVLDRTKKAYFSPNEPEIKISHQPAMTTKQQFKAMCKCLLGKKKTPHKISKLYNTPSASVIDSTSRERSDAGSSHVSEHHSHREKHVKKSKREKSQERRPKVKSKSRPKHLENAPMPIPIVEHSVTENTPTESLYTQRHSSTTEESIEYLTVRLQHFRSNNMCPCGNKSEVPPKLQEEQAEQVKVVSQKTEAWTITETKDDKETQTSQIQEEHKNVGSSINDELYTEKLVKIKGKKHKTICLMVCCCGHHQGKSPVECTCEKCTNLVLKNGKEGTVKSQKLDQMEKLFGGGSPNFETGDELRILPLAVSTSLSTKKLSKFGTPSKNYPWLQNTESTGTTTSLNNIETRINALSDIYEWLDPDLDINCLTQTRLPDLLDITDDLSYFKKLDTSNKSNPESRILLDAVCDAILQEHEDKTCQAWDDDQFKTKQEITQTYRDLGVLCNLNSETKTDVYTGLSKAIINCEDVGVQLSNTSNLSNILERTDVNRLDDVMNDIMNNIFSESKDNIKNTNGHSPNPNESKQYKPENSIDFTEEATSFTRTGLLPQQTCNVFRKTGKRGASALEKEHECKKKLKQEEEISWRNVAGNGQASNRIGHIFSKIEDIVHKSKVKSAEIQKVLSIVPNKGEDDTEDIENVLSGPSSQNDQKSHSNQSGIESINFDLPKNVLKRNYRMSSDNFKGTICETMKNHFRYIKNNSENGEKTCFTTQAKYGQNLDYRFSGTSDVNENDCPKKSDNRKIDEKVSKLSIHNFLVFDEKPMAVPKAPVAGFSGLRSGKQSIKGNNSKGSLIPIRKRNTTD